MRWKKLAAALSLVLASTLPPSVARAQSLRMLVPGVFVSGSIAPADIAKARQGGVSLVIDLLPDEDAAASARSPQMQAAARDADVAFVYAPTPSSPLSPAAVEQADKALSTARGPVLLYCRSGARAARVWALVEATRPNGMSAAEIGRAAAAAGFSIDDARPELERRVAARAVK